MMEVIAGISIVIVLAVWTRITFRAGVRWGKTQGFVDGLAAHRDIEVQRQVQQRKEWIDYMNSRDMPDPRDRNREEDKDDPVPPRE